MLLKVEVKAPHDKDILASIVQLLCQEVKEMSALVLGSAIGRRVASHCCFEALYGRIVLPFGEAGRA